MKTNMKNMILGTLILMATGFSSLGFAGECSIRRTCPNGTVISCYASGPAGAACNYTSSGGYYGVTCYNGVDEYTDLCPTR